MEKRRFVAIAAGATLLLLAVLPELLQWGEPGFGPLQILFVLLGGAAVFIGAKSDQGTLDIAQSFAQRWLARAPALAIVLVVILTIAHFPNEVGELQDAAVVDEGEAFYEDAYTPPDPEVGEGESDDGEDYVETAREAAEHKGVGEDVAAFVETYRLKGSRVLEVGAGSGTLQDLVDDYVGLDIAASAARFFHKPFVQGSATNMPFEDDSFDATWSVWVLEHVPNPELALVEMRRVVRDGGLIYLRPAWSCEPWRTEGYDIRPYSDFGLRGKLIKASIPLRSHPIFRYLYEIPIRMLRTATSKVSSSPTRLRYRAIDANFDHYWGADSDAVNNIDAYEARLWFESRGDECVNCGSALSELRSPTTTLIVRVRKSDGQD